MTVDRFETLLRSFSTTPSRRAVAQGLSGLLISEVLAPWLGVADAAAKRKKKKKKKHVEEQVTLCMNGQTLTVPESIALSLIAQGATYGACPPPPPPPPPCVPTCGAAHCGPNGCGGTCGTCLTSQQCCNCGPTRPGECLPNNNTCEIWCNAI